MTNEVDASDEAVDTRQLARAGENPPTGSAVIRERAADFCVEEQCPVQPTGTGEHLWLWLEKTNLTTAVVARWLARAAGVATRDVGYSGLKDRHAVTRQWFSLPWPIRHGDAPLQPDADALPENGQARILEQVRHDRKLRRGTHRVNAFDLRLRHITDPQNRLQDDLERIRRDGVPNYFGPQRFGRGGHNLALAHSLFAGKRLKRDKRGFALSAARSHLFNQVLAQRVENDTWQRILPGEAVMLDGSNSVFAAEIGDATLARRVAEFDIHPTGPLPGRTGKPIVTGDAAALEQAILGAHADLLNGLQRLKVDAARRALRLPVRDLTWTRETDTDLKLSFTLPTGGFATSVLRELARIEDATQC